jgi:hypothetical protein
LSEASTATSRPLELATRAHYFILAAAFAYLLWVNRHQWFSGDEWSFLVDRGLDPTGDDVGIFEPHNEHWSTIPVLKYRALFALFGARTYLPYLTVAIVVHLFITHLLWRLLRRVGVRAWLATVAVAFFAVMGIAWENVTTAFQFQLIGPLLTGLAALLLLPTDGPLSRRDAGVVGLLIVGLMFSGIGVTMVIVVALAAALRRRWPAAALTVVVPGIVYGAWYLAEGQDAPEGPLQKPFGDALLDVPEYVWKGLSGAIDGLTDLEVIGHVAIVVLFIWLLTRVRTLAEPWPLVLAPAAGAVVFLGLTTIRRSGLGIETAASSRYAYVVLALLLPAVALAIDSIRVEPRWRWVALAVVGLPLLAVQVHVLTREADATAAREQEEKHRIVAAAQLARAGIPTIATDVVPVQDPYLELVEIAQLDRAGDLPGNVEPTPADLLTARVYLQVEISGDALVDDPAFPDDLAVPGPDPGAGGGCVTAARGDARRPVVAFGVEGPTALELTSTHGGTMTIRLREADVRGRARRVELPAARPAVLSLVGDADAVLTLPRGSSTICAARG